MKKINLNANTKSKSYNIIIGRNIISKINNILKLNKIKIKKVLIVLDTKIPKKKLILLKKKINSKKIITFHFNASEKNKNLKSINLILEKLFLNNFNRRIV